MINLFVIIGGLINLLGVAAYIRDTLRGTTKPNRVTWFMWSIAPLIGTFAAISDGVTWAVLPVFMSGFAPFLVFLVSFANKNSYWKLERFDYLCGGLSVIALILWGLTKQPAIAILFAILSDGTAAVPTLIKSYRHPETESSAAYWTGAINALTSFTVIKSWTFTSYAFPLYLVLMNTALFLSGLRLNNLKNKIS